MRTMPFMPEMVMIMMAIDYELNFQEAEEVAVLGEAEVAVENEEEVLEGHRPADRNLEFLLQV